ncbi:MAG: NUDIX domain-containing protein [Chloroflexi bacterium]|nr:NUDIX domain-containing protein [Chloroflexota bacterium]MCI0581020.1 NUDIX domain-containing protein [Chloroflexota bacterium]MCI0646359.1 NUDIX domain-containing protein [Chloroflexota bacterium]MCI0728383.1 NUDIX domain-containing protein [Chloroflexota bacterium]
MPPSYIEWIRSRVGRRKIFLTFATTVLHDDAGRILLQRRTDFDWWGLPGGVLEIEEDILTCARRELLEEVGLAAGELRLVGVYTDPRYEVTYPNGDQVQQFTVCFSGPLAGGRLRLEETEVRGVRWFEPASLPWGEIPLWYTDMLRNYLAGGPPAFEPPARTGQTAAQIASVRAFIGQAMVIGVGGKTAVVRDDGRVLMVRRGDNGAWVFPGGFCDLGENVAATAVREMREEAGLEVALERILGVYSSPHFHYTYPNGDQVKSVAVLFRARPAGGMAGVDGQESLELAWLTPAEVLAKMDGHPFKPLYTAAIQHLDEGHFVL